MGHSHFIRGGDYAPPRAWVERLAAAGFDVELPDDLRPVTGGTFGIRFKHPEVTGGEDALMRVGILYHLLAADTPVEVVEHFERRFQELVEERWPGSVLLNRAISLGWAKEGRAGVLRYLDVLRAQKIEIGEEIARYWSDPNAKLEQEIEFWASGHDLCSMVAHDVIARAIADATGGRLASDELRALGEPFLNEEDVRATIALARYMPFRFDFSPEDAARWPVFERFVNWEHVRAQEAEEDAEEAFEEEEEPEG